MKKNNRKKVLKTSLKRGDRGIKLTDECVQIMGVSISGTRINKVLNKIWLQRKEMLHVATVNPEYIMQARSDPTFRQVLEKCLTVADGWGVVWASQIRGTAPIERMSGVELANQIIEHAATHGEKVFLLGAKVGVAELAAAKMRTKYPQLQIAWYEGARSVKVERDEEASMTIAKINTYEPDYLLVAYGSPMQDKWIEENRPYLRVRVAMGIGGTLDEWVGRVKLCPKWIDQLGFKWLWRVLHEPWRWKRIMNVIYFGILVVSKMVLDKQGKCK